MVRPLLVAGAALVALTLAGPALAARVHVRVEGAKMTIFGATEPRLAPVRGTFTPPQGEAVTVAADTPLGALERASRRGEFFYRLESFSFGPYVAQIGRLSGSATTGWVYKVNGGSPPVSATAYELKEGDRVLWYFARFGAAGGPKTLRLARVRVPTASARTRTCFDAVLEDDNGRRAPARSAVFRLDARLRRTRLSAPSGARRICPSGHWHRLRALAPGAIRSQVVVGPRTSATGAAASLTGRSL
ncbi:MAG: DUF4430 domain-containing protein [Thermoleophilia bacterium]|nr:DUF4430 domain-containing protein [Thermoleophilia bacterium]